jgi:hypothetical protein
VAIAGIALLVLGGLFIVGNLSGLVYAAVTRSSTSLLPPFGGVFAFAGAMMLPVIGWKLGLLALVLDPSCLLLAIFAVVSRLKRRDSGPT